MEFNFNLHFNTRTIGIRKDNMKKKEFDLLLNEIPHATSVNLENPLHLHLQQQYEIVDDSNGNFNGSPVSGLSLQSRGSSSSSSLHGLEEIKPQTPVRNTHYLNKFRPESKLPADLSEHLYKLSVKDDPDNIGNFQFSDSMRTNNGHGDNNNCLLESNVRYPSDSEGFSDLFPASLMTLDDVNEPTLLGGFQEKSQICDLSGSSYVFPRYTNDMFPYLGSSFGTPWQQRLEHLRIGETLMNSQFQDDALFIGDSDPIDTIHVPTNLSPTRQSFVSHDYFGGVSGIPISPYSRNSPIIGTTPNNWTPQSISSVTSTRGVEAFDLMGNWITQGNGLNDAKKKGSNGLSHLKTCPMYGKSNNTPKMCCCLIMPSNYNLLRGLGGNIYSLAKDQHGCRFLQRKLDKGTPQEIQMIFHEIIDHVVELMTNPSGNYLIQKLLDLCNEEQRMQILITITSPRNQLVKISLNVHGTRVVQKLIGTLKTREQISLVVSALEPGFFNLIKDANGNHVLQRCLQCLSNEDNKFIFDAAARFCVDIATNQHGCCVLQKCIGHSTGARREKLLAEISTHGLFLAQDAYGNYVIQYVIEQQSPPTNTTLHSLFTGNYTSLSLQKCSSHVVENCLRYFNEDAQSEIVHELLSCPRFEQFVQDQYANYVIQSGLKFCKGLTLNALVGAIRQHITTLKTSPYCKKIYSKVVLRKRDM